jgi:hypothetical protein
MAYILPSDLPDPQSRLFTKKSKEAWKQYRSHLLTWQKRLPPKALAFALADWHYDHSDHRCPHDSWLEDLRIEEGPGASPVHERTIRIVILLLGAYHDGQLRVVYDNVFSYALDFAPPKTRATSRSHGDWLIDEIRSEGHRGRATHEIHWANGGEWIIEAAEIEAIWEPHPITDPKQDFAITDGDGDTG